MRASKFRVVTIAIAFMVAFGATAHADVTGYFETHISFHPQSTVSEIELMDFDIENDLTITVSISGLTTTLHTHFGIAGVEDLQVISNATLGALDIKSHLVFARFAYNSIVPFYDSLHFVKKVVSASLTLGGVAFTNIAMFEDTNAFINPTFTAYAFGNAIRLSGSTPSGIGITAEAGICMEETVNRIKKHPNISPYSVNPECATQPKPDMLFDFENVFITGVPLAQNIVGSASLRCIKVQACSLIANLNMMGGPIPFSADLLFIGPDSGILFDQAIITFAQGDGQFQLFLDPTGGVSAMNVKLVGLLASNLPNDDDSASIELTVVPGSFMAALVALTVRQAGLELSVEATFLGVGTLSPDFQIFAFSLKVPGSLLELSSTGVFTVDGLQRADIDFRIKF